MAPEKGKHPIRRNRNAEEIFPDVSLHPVLNETQDKSIQNLWNGWRILKGDTPDTLGDPELDEYSFWIKFRLVADLSERINAGIEKGQRQQMERCDTLGQHLNQLTDVMQKLTEQNANLKKESAVWHKQLLDAGLQPKKIVYSEVPKVPMKSVRLPADAKASTAIPPSPSPPLSSAGPEAPASTVEQESSGISHRSTPVDIKNTPTARGNDTDSDSSGTGLDLDRARLLSSTPAQIIRFPAPVTDRTGDRPAFEYAFSDNLKITPNALYNPEIRAFPASPASRTVSARSGVNEIKVSISADYPATVLRLAQDHIVYPESEHYPVGYTQSNETGQLRLPLPLTLEEIFTGVTKKVTFFRIVGRDNNGSLKKRQVDMKVNVEPGVRRGQSVRYERAGNVTIRGPQDACFTVYEIEHPVYERNHSTLKMSHKGRYFGRNTITLTSVDGVRRCKQFGILDWQPVFHRLGMPSRGPGDGKRRGDIMAYPG